MPINKELHEIIDFIREFLRDDKKFNKLLGEEEHTDNQIKKALVLALDDFNNTILPYTNYSLENIKKFPSLKVLVDGTVIELLLSAGILQSRNRLNYSDGGITVSVSDKASDYQGWLQVFVNTYERRKMSIKNAENVNRGWAAVSTPYRYTNFRR